MPPATASGWLNHTCQAPRPGNPPSEPARMPSTRAAAASDILLPFPPLHPAPRVPQTPSQRRIAKVNPPGAAEATGWHPALSPKSARRLSCPHGGCELSARVSLRGSPQRGGGPGRGTGAGRAPLPRRGRPGTHMVCSRAGAERLRVCCLPLQQRWLSGSAPAASGLLLL